MSWVKTMTRLSLSLFVLVLSVGSVACGGGAGPHIRVATATATDLEAVKDEETVWYEFRKGDVVPFQFVMIGAAQTGTPAFQVQAAQDFWLVMSEEGPMQISYDGKSVSSTSNVELISLVVPGNDGKAKLLWINYFGPEGDAGEELKRMLQAAEGQSISEEPAAPAGQAESIPAE